MSELEDLIAETRDRERNHRIDTKTRAVEGESMVDEIHARQRGQTAAEARQARADAEERDRLRRLGVRVD